MMSASEGGMEKRRSKGGCVNFILQISSKEEGEGIKKAENIADVINGCSLTESSHANPPRRAPHCYMGGQFCLVKGGHCI